ncbi:MAG TPA: carboxypeptidase-like regulatory domain-containing protein [Candidatus Limnocylindrales bacterium]|nr:carboxypeptidase-like regulatory domain-containing protein [Candidatus Limnocylindrales bacterium]
MSRHFRITTRAWLAFVLASPVTVFGHPLPQAFAPGEESIVVRGTVVSSVDGKPIRAALVQLLGDSLRATLTGSDGSFLFEGLTSGDVVLTARKPGFFSPQEYSPESVGEQRIHLAPNLPVIELKLYPEAVLYGRVTNENGRPLEGFSVQLRRAGAKGSASGRESMATAVTNENGEYRLAELRAGTYLINVSRNLETEGVSALLRGVRSRFGYPSTFYPGVTDPSLATPVRLTPGKQVQADLHLSAQPLYRISGTVQGASPDAPVIVAMAGEHDESPVAVGTSMPGVGTFALEGVPAGNYFLGAFQVSGTDERMLKTGVAHIEVTRNMDSVSIVLAEEQKVPVRFHYDFPPSGGNQIRESRGLVILSRVDVTIGGVPTARTLDRGAENTDAAYIISLAPGTYRASLNEIAGLCVGSVRSGSADLLKEDLIVVPGGSVEPIEVVVRNNCGRVSGAVSAGGRPAMGRVLLIPEDAPRRGVSVPANSDGTFQIANLLPGKYLAVALDGADDLEPDQAETLLKVKSRATSVEVEPSATANLRLELKSFEP